MSIVNRRSFIGSTAMGVAALSRISHAADEKKLRFGVIGCGWYGMVDAKAAFAAGGVEAVALCDADSEHLEKSSAEIEKLQGSRPKTYKHYQEMLDAGGMDFVIIATPPHWHALPFIATCKKGLPIYCEKPLAYDIYEGKAMIEAQKKAGNIVQIGFQRRQSAAVNEAKKFIQDGGIGRVAQVEARIYYTANVDEYKPQDPPATLDWDLWCGPAPKLDYSPNIGHFNWRLEKEYGNGHLVDWGIHWMDSIRMTLDLATPHTISAAGGLYELKNRITTPDILTVHFDFHECPVIWNHRIWGAAEYTPEITNCIFYMGEKGTVIVSDNQWIHVTKGRDAKSQVNKPAQDTKADVEHMKDFLNAVRTGSQPSCLITDAWQSTTTVHLGAIAYNAKQQIHWNAETGTIDIPEAAKQLARPYRAPYKRPNVG